MDLDIFLQDTHLPITLVHIPIPFYLKGADRRFVFCNVAFYEMAGVKRTSDIIGKRAEEVEWSDAMPLWCVDEARHFDSTETILLDQREGVSCNIYSNPTLPIDQKKFLQGDVMVVAGERGEIWTLSIFSDVTGYEAAKHRAQMANLRAEATSRELIEYLHKINQMREKAERSNRIKSEFLANISHEIRNPMNAIQGLAQILMETELSPQQREYISHIQQTSETLLCAINDTIDIYKIESGDIEIVNETVHLRSFLMDVKHMLSVHLREKDVELIITLSPQLPETIIIDRRRFQQMLLNLGMNAIRYTDKGHIYINLGITQLNKGKKALLIEVEDTGAGMTPNQLQTIFDWFAGDDSYTSKQGGTGIGLAICQKLSYILGGEINVESKEGQGSAFWVTLPLNTNAATEMKGKQTLSGLRILFVGQDKMFRSIASRINTRWKAQVNVVETAEKALFTIRENEKRGKTYDFAIISEELPGLSGVDLVGHMERDYKSRNIYPIVLLSEGSAIDSRIDAVLVKPFTISDILIKIFAVQCMKENNAGKSAIGAIREEKVKDINVKSKFKNYFDAKVLVVEDHYVNQLVVSSVLKKMGCRVDIASDGLEGLRQATFNDYDIILMDIEMPEMNGIEVTEEIRLREKCEDGQHRIIIAVTANAMLGDRERCLEAGMDDYMRKPVNETLLYDMLKKWLPKEKSIARSAS